MIKTLLLQFRQRFFFGKLYSQSLHGVSEKPLNEAVERWIVPREYCLFYRHSLEAVPEKQRSAALQNYLSLLSPFVEFDYWVYWEGGDALIWLWSKARLARVQQKYFSTTAPEKLQNIPESALSPQNLAGAVCYQLESGYLGQYWHEGQLRGDYWWATEPSASDWQYFLKGTGANVEGAFPKIQKLAETPKILWAISMDWNESARKMEAPMLQLSGVILAFFLLYFGIGFLRLLVSEGQLKDDLVNAQTQAENIVLLRETVYQQRGENQALINLKSPGQLSLMLAVAETLPETATNIQRWNYADGKLEVLLNDLSPDLAGYVDRLESQSLFTRVTAEPASRGSQVMLKMELRP